MERNPLPHRLMMKTKILMLILPFLIFTSCSDDEVVNVKEPMSIEGQTLEDEVNKVNFLLDSGRLLRNSNEWDFERTRSMIQRIYAANIRLYENPFDRSALISLKDSIKFYDDVFISERDKPRFDVLFNNAYSLLVRYANIQGVNIEDVQWTLFSYRFSQDVSPFGSTDVPNLWSIRPVQQERYAINVRGEDKQAVLLTPTFDLTKTKNPAYQLRHSFQLEEHFRPRPFFNREQILNEAFRVYVSTTYKDGDKVNFRDPKQWKRVSLGDLPLGLNFNTVDSGRVSLKEFAGKKITMAMVYRNASDIGNHILSWAIERFELYGVSADFSYKKRPQPFDPDAQDILGTTIWEHDFNRVQLGDLEQVTIEGNPADFRNTERNGTKYVSAGSQGTEGTKLLYSAPINLAGKSAPHIRIEHTINFYDPPFQKKNHVKLMVAEENSSLPVEQLNWIAVNFELNNPPGSDWSIYKTEFVLLPKSLMGKSIRIGLSHTSEGNSSPAWQIHQLDLRDIPELK